MIKINPRGQPWLIRTPNGSRFGEYGNRKRVWGFFLALSLDHANHHQSLRHAFLSGGNLSTWVFPFWHIKVLCMYRILRPGLTPETQCQGHTPLHLSVAVAADFFGTNTGSQKEIRVGSSAPENREPKRRELPHKRVVVYPPAVLRIYTMGKQ